MCTIHCQKQSVEKQKEKQIAASVKCSSEINNKLIKHSAVTFDAYSPSIWCHFIAGNALHGSHLLSVMPENVGHFLWTITVIILDAPPTGCARGLGWDGEGLLLRLMPSCLTHINYYLLRLWARLFAVVSSVITICRIYTVWQLGRGKRPQSLFSLSNKSCSLFFFSF